MTALGRHVLVELFDCGTDVINDLEAIRSRMLEAAEKSGATIIDSTFHMFSPYGISGTVVIAESHFAIHTWPEYGYAAVDLFTCGEKLDSAVAVDHLKKAFGAAKTEVVEMKRGRFDSLKQRMIVGGPEFSSMTGLEAK